MENTIIEKLDKLCIEKRSFINGTYVDAIDGGIINKTSPVDGRDLSGISSCNVKDIDCAVNVARNSFKSGLWSNKNPEEKKNILLKMADLMESNREELALIDTVETGRSFRNYLYDSIPKAIQALRYFAESVDKYYDYSIPPRNNSFAVITREPLGVVGIITPWNDPLVVSTWKFSPALLMGNSVVIKPAEQSSLSLLKVAKLAQEAGIPDGVFNVVTGFGESAGKALALHTDVNGVFFTGSSEVGKMIMRYSGQSNLKKVGLECGGKSSFILSKKTNNLERAAEILAKNIFYNQGQICSAPSKLIIDYSIKAQFLELLVNESKKYIPKNPFDINSEVGCVISREHQQRIQKYIEEGINSGAKMIRPDNIDYYDYDSCSIIPTIFDDVSIESRIAQEEIFGPVLIILGYNNINDAISIANNTKYGLAASIWTNDLDEAYYVSRRLYAGIVHINSYGDDDNSAPFGGVKESGIGKDKSIFAFDEYSYLKTTWINFSSL